MAYAKVGPFVDQSGPPFLSATFFNGVETALATATPTTVSGMPIASGDTVTLSIPSFSGGTLTIFATAGGAWSSVWFGVYAADNGRVDLTQIATDFTAPGQLITSVTGSTTSNTVTVTTAATGSGCLLSYTIARAGGGS